MTIKEYVQGRTTEELKEELKGLRQAIDDFQCFNSQDILILDAIEAELTERELNYGRKAN